MEQTYEHCSVDQIVQMAGQTLKVAGQTLKVAVRQQEVHLKLEVLQEGDVYLVKEVLQRVGVHRMVGDRQLEVQKWTWVEG